MLNKSLLIGNVIVLMIFMQNIHCQSRWIREYHTGTDTWLTSIIESYDKGYLLSGKHGANYSRYNWLIKTDRNGEILWEKTIGDGIHSIVLIDFDQDEVGNTHLCGLTRYYDSEGDPLIIKLDTCGEKQWCNVFHTLNHYDFSSNLTVTPEGNVVMILNLTNPETWVESICLAKLSTSGELVWKQCYTSSDTSQRNEITYDLTFTPDHGFLITGFCYYEDPVYPNHWIPHPYFLKVDSLGNFEWETVIFKETNLDGGVAWSAVLSPNENFYYSSISHYTYDDNKALPALAKVDLQGNVVGVYDVVSGVKYGVLAYAQFLNDSTLAASAGWGNNTDSLWSKAVIIDTLGYLLNSSILLENDYTSVLQVTYDGKLVYGSNSYQDGQFDCFLTKLNQDLGQDTLYTMPFTYDSLCPYQIVSDTIVQDDCGLIVGIEEEEETGGQGDLEMMGGLEIWPNPCREMLNVECLMLNESENYKLNIYDIFGRTAPARALSLPRLTPIPGPSPSRGKGEAVWQVNVSTLPPGVYLAVVREGTTIVARAKFVVAR
jgi:hypothetical protein